MGYMEGVWVSAVEVSGGGGCCGEAAARVTGEGAIYSQGLLQSVFFMWAFLALIHNRNNPTNLQCITSFLGQKTLFGLQFRIF